MNKGTSKQAKKQVLLFWSALMFWPVIFGLARALMKNQQKPGTLA